MKELVVPIIIGGLVIFALGTVWYSTIVQWTYQENLKLFIEGQCYKPNVVCSMPQNPLMIISMLGIAVCGLIVTTFCYNRFTYEKPNLREDKQ